jgi:hypothetical protein
MRSSVFLAGIVLIAIGALGIFYYYPQYQNLSSTLGQIGQAISPELKQQYTNLQIYLGSFIVAAILGLGLVVYGASTNK